jgi:hypothetical protein
MVLHNASLGELGPVRGNQGAGVGPGLLPHYRNIGRSVAPCHPGPVALAGSDRPGHVALGRPGPGLSEEAQCAAATVVLEVGAGTARRHVGTADDRGVDGIHRDGGTGSLEGHDAGPQGGVAADHAGENIELVAGGHRHRLHTRMNGGAWRS